MQPSAKMVSKGERKRSREEADPTYSLARNNAKSPRTASANTIEKELPRVQLKRDQLEKWCQDPLFDRLVAGSWVRMAVQGQYHVCEVVGVRVGQKYALGKACTAKHLVVRHGGAQTWTYKMAFVSNQAFPESEIRGWKETCRPLPTLEHLEKKGRDISGVLKELDVSPHNYAKAKIALLMRLETAVLERNADAVSDLQARIESIDQRTMDLENARTERSINFKAPSERVILKNVEKCARRGIQPRKNTEAEDYDPFSRRKCAPVLFAGKKSQTTSLQ